MNKAILTIIISILTLLSASYASAAECGGTTQCQCGDTLVESQTMWYDLQYCSADGLIIGADDIFLDCNGHTITGTGGDYERGVKVQGHTGVSITGCNINYFYEGVYVGSSSSVTVTGNSFRDSTRAGISAFGTLTATGNNVEGSEDHGIALFVGSDNSVVSGNTVTNNPGDGIYLSLVTGCTVTDNIATYNLNGINIWNPGTTDNYIANNVANYNSGSGTNSGNGILILGHNNEVASNTANYNSHYGIHIYESQDNEVHGNEMTGNGVYGIYLHGFYIYPATGNALYENYFEANREANAYENGLAYDNYWDFEGIGNEWDDFLGNAGYPYYYEIEGWGGGIDWHPIGGEMIDLYSDLTPTGMTTIPSNGGTLEYNIEVGNNGGSPIEIDVWEYLTLPSGAAYGPILGPVSDFTMPGAWSGNRDRRLNIPGGAPEGTYTVNSYVGIYDEETPLVMAEDHFDFIKEGTDGGNEKIADTGNDF